MLNKNIIKEKDNGRVDFKSRIIELEDTILEKERRIKNIEFELNLIKKSKVWRLSEFFRKLFFVKFLEKFPGVHRIVLSVYKDGFVKTFGKAIYRILKHDTKNYKKWIKKNSLNVKKIKEIKKDIDGFKYNPKFSIIMPVYNVDQTWLKKAVDSVFNQLYENWELCIADDASSKEHIKSVLIKYDKNDYRIKIKFLKENQGIPGASNEALSMATGEFIGLLDNDDELSIDALYENVKLLNAVPDANMIYSDEDKLDIKGKRSDPFFKPDWSPDMLFSCMYTGHFGVYRKKIVDEIGGFRIGYEGSQDYDLALRFSERTDRILHLPKILYHWRKIRGSVAFADNSKNYAYVSAIKALSDAMERRDIPAKVYRGDWTGSYRIKYEIDNFPKISILIPLKGHVSILKKCVESILSQDLYLDYEVLIIDNNRLERETVEYLSSLSGYGNVSILNYNSHFNLSEMNNYGVRKSTGDILLFFDDKCEVRSEKSIMALVEHVQRKNVGAVGAKLVFNNNTIQHCGIILKLGSDGIAGHHSYNYPDTNKGYFGKNSIVHNVSAVTGSAMMVRKDVFNKVNGFDEKIATTYNDVDFCLKLREAGYHIVYTPYAKFYFNESVVKKNVNGVDKKMILKKEIDYFKIKWKSILGKGDPYYNPNLSLDGEGFFIRL